MLERGYSTEDSSNTLRIQEAGPLGRRFFINTRASINWSKSSAESLFERPDDPGARRIHQRRAAAAAAGSRSKTLNLQSDLDYVRGIHSVRTGLQLDGGIVPLGRLRRTTSGPTRSRAWPQFQSGTAAELHDPHAAIRTSPTRTCRPAWYLQDDIRVRRNLTLSPGIRYEAQTHLSDYNNFGPRFGVTWSPGKSGKTTLRGSAGIFYDWLSTNTYEQTLRVDGFRQQRDEHHQPVVSDPGSRRRHGVADEPLPAGRRSPDAAATSGSARASSRTVTRMLSVNATYAHTSGDNLMRGLNLNAPVNGVRPDPRFVNVVQVHRRRRVDASTPSTSAPASTSTCRRDGAGRRPRPAARS